MTPSSPNGSSSNGHAPVQKQSSSSLEQLSILDQAERVRDSLTESLTDVRSLITSLKKQKKQNQLVRSTLASLRELEAV